MDETNMIYGRASVELLVSWSWGECGELVGVHPSLLDARADGRELQIEWWHGDEPRTAWVRVDTGESDVDAPDEVIDYALYLWSCERESVQ